MQKIIITGGSGYIGSHTCKEVALAGYQPIIVDREESSHAKLLQEKYNAVFRKIDITDEHDLTAFFKKHSDALGVIHFAGLISVAESCHKPNLYYKNNIVGSAHILAAMEAANLKNIVFSSSAAVYGIAEKCPISEDTLANPINPYGHSKRVFEVMMEGLANSGIIQYASLRYFNACGADKDGELGECHDPETHLIPLAIEAAYKGTTFNIFGDDYDTKDGTAIRDYIHVKDLAIAHIKAIEYIARKKKSITANLGTGSGYSVSQIVRTIEQVSGRKINTEFKERRAGDPPRLIANNKKAMDEMGFIPENSDLNNIITTAIAWYEKYSKLNERTTKSKAA